MFEGYYPNAGIYTILNYLTDGEGAAYFYNSDGRRNKGKVENYYYLPDCSEKDTDSINRGGMIQPIGCHFLTEDDEKVWNDNWINSSFNVCTRNGMGRGKLCSG